MAKKKEEKTNVMRVLEQKKKGLFKYLNLNNDLACIYIYCKYNLNDFVIDLNYN